MNYPSVITIDLKSEGTIIERDKLGIYAIYQNDGENEQHIYMAPHQARLVAKALLLILKQDRKQRKANTEA